MKTRLFKLRQKWRWRRWIHIGLLLLSTGQAALCSTPTLVRLYWVAATNAQIHSGFFISLDRADPVPPPSNPETWGQIQVYAPAGQPFLIVGALAPQTLDLELEWFPGWRAALPSESYISLRSLDDQRSVEVFADRHNRGLVSLTLPDGARADLNGGDSVRFEGFTDHSYNLFGRGLVQGRTADGAAQMLGVNLPPITGGPVVRTTNDHGQIRLRRLAPCAELFLQGQPGTDVTARLEQETISLLPNIPQTLSQANGASIVLELEAEAVKFRVQRGYFIASIPGMRACQPHLWTGQEGRLRWDTDLHAVEISAGANPLLVALPIRSHAMIQSGATLQVAQISPSTFGASAAEGEVQLFDPITRRTSPLGQAQTVVQSRPEIVTSTRLLLRLTTDDKGQFVLADPSDARRILLAAAQTWQVDASHEIRVKSDPQLARVDLQALSGSFLIRMPMSEHMDFELEEPNGIAWFLAPERPTTRAQALAENPTSIAIHTQSGQVMLSPGGEILIMSASWTLGTKPSVIFSELEPAGAGSGGRSFLDSSRDYIPRIEQPPVSIVR